MRNTGGYITATEPVWTSRAHSGMFSLDDLEELRARKVLWSQDIQPVYIGNAFLSTLRSDPIGADQPKFTLGNAFLSTLRSDPIGADQPKFTLGNAFLSVLRSDPI